MIPISLTRISFRKLHWVIGLLFITVLAVVLLYDIAVFVETRPASDIVVWRIDDCLAGMVECDKRLPMIFSGILAGIAAGILFCAFTRLNKLRRRKEDPYMATMIRNAVLYLAFARVGEIYYILTLSDLEGMLNSLGRFYVPLDTLSLALYMIFCTQVFLGGTEKQERRLNRIIYALLVAGFAASVFTSFENMLENFLGHSEINPLVIAVAAVVIVGSAIVACVVAYKILGVRARITENRAAFLGIGVQLLLFVAMLLLTLYMLLQTGALSYWFRTVKNAVLIVQGILLFPTFIKPAKLGGAGKAGKTGNAPIAKA